jgi:transcription antitermination factor NusG
MNPKWYAVYTKPRWEKKVAELFTKRKIENYCPLNMVVRQWSDRKMKVHEPLFTSYVFVHVTEKELYPIKEVSGVVNLVYWLSKPAVIKDHEIETIKDFLGEYKTVRLETVDVNIHDRVRVASGPLMDYEGSVAEVNNNTVKIILPSLGYMMMAEVEKSNVEIINYRTFTKPSYAARYAIK